MASTVRSNVQIETALHVLHPATYTQDTVVTMDVRQAGRVSTVQKVVNYISDSKHTYTICNPSVVSFDDITYICMHTHARAHMHTRVLTCNAIYLSHKINKKTKQTTTTTTIIFGVGLRLL